MRSHAGASPRVVVVGSGIVGLCLSWELLRQRPQLELVCYGDRVGGASVAATGVSCQKGVVGSSQERLQLKLQGQKVLRRLLCDLGVAVREQVWEAYNDPAAARELMRRPYRDGPKGLCAVTLRRQLGEGVSQIHPAAIGAVCFESDFSYDPLKLLNALEAAVMARGCRREVAHLHSGRDGSGRRWLRAGSRTVWDEGGSTHLIVAAGSGSVPLCQGWGDVLPERFVVEGATWRGEWRGIRSALGLPGALRVGQKSLVFDADPCGLVRFGSVNAEKNGSQLWDERMLRASCSEVFPGIVLGRGAVATGIRLCFRRSRQLELIRLGSRLWLATGAYKSGYDLAPLLSQRFSREILAQLT